MSDNSSKRQEEIYQILQAIKSAGDLLNHLLNSLGKEEYILIAENYSLSREFTRTLGFMERRIEVAKHDFDLWGTPLVGDKVTHADGRDGDVVEVLDNNLYLVQTVDGDEETLQRFQFSVLQNEKQEEK